MSVSMSVSVSSFGEGCCGWDASSLSVHSSTPFMFQFGGKTSVGTVSSTFDYSIETAASGSWDLGFVNRSYPNVLYSATSFGTYGPLGRWAAGVHYTGSGIIVVYGGKVSLTLIP
jgi:hypothetical protein